MAQNAIKPKIIYLPVKPCNAEVIEYEFQQEEEREEEQQKSSGILPDLLLSAYAIGWGIWMFPYSLLLGSALLVSAGALSARAFKGLGM